MGKISTPWSSYALALASAAMVWLGFAGMDVWPLAFIAYLPLQLALERETPLERGHWPTLKLGLVFGFVAMFGGYYWLIHVLKDFSGFPLSICILLASVLVLQQSGAFVLLAWLWVTGRRRGLGATVCLTAAGVTSEFIYPLLFPYYYGASFHQLPLLMQPAELGGPLLISAISFLINGVLFELMQAWRKKQPWPKQTAAVAAVLLIAAGVFAVVRMAQIDRQVATAAKIKVGLVQANMGIFSKRNDPIEGLRRHIRLSQELELKTQLDLLVWPESAYAWRIDESVQNVQDSVLGPLTTPVLFGGLAQRSSAGERQLFNTAFLTDAGGNVVGTYDKTYLLAFGEYLPFGDIFPVLYEWSPQSGHFTKGSHVRALPFGQWRLGALICYEDILPHFVRKLMRASSPHLLINITNDAWFGDTTEPWEHLALAKFRAVEQRRYLLRATNSGVSAIIDPVGRLVSSTPVFVQSTLSGEVAMMEGRTLYGRLGDWPGWLALLLSAWVVVPPRLRSLPFSKSTRRQ